MAAERKQAKMIADYERSIRPTCGGIERNCFTNPPGNSLNTAGHFPIEEISQNAQPTGNQAVIENDETSMTTARIITHSSPLSITGSVCGSSIGNIENETNSQKKVLLQQPDPKSVDMQDIFDDIIAPDKNLFICLDCGNEYECNEQSKIHLAARHPQVFFAHVKERLLNELTPEDVHFHSRCKNILQDESNLAKNFTKDAQMKGHVKISIATILCPYCNTLYGSHQFKLHMFQKHYNVLENKLIASYGRRKIATYGIDSEKALNVQSTSWTEPEQNQKPGHSRNFTFAWNTDTAKYYGKDITPSNINCQTSSVIVNMNMKGYLPQNLENKSMEESKGFSKRKKSYSAKGITIGATVKNGLTNPPQRNSKKRNGNNAPYSGTFSHKQISGFSTKEQPTGHQTNVEISQNLSTHIHQSSPLTTSSVCEASSLTTKPIVQQQQQHGTKPVYGGFYSEPPGIYYDSFMEICERYKEHDENSSRPFKCLVCEITFACDRVPYHLMTLHPEVFFAEVKSRLSAPEPSFFNDSCKIILRREVGREKQSKRYVGRKGNVKKSEKLTCIYCRSNAVYTFISQLKFHLFQHHHNVLEEKLIAHCEESGIEMARESNPPKKVVNVQVQSTLKKKLNQFLVERQQQQSDPGKQIPASNKNDHLSADLEVNTERNLSQNSEYKSIDGNGRQGFAEEDKSSEISTVEEIYSTNCFPRLAPIQMDKFGENYTYTTTEQYYKAALRFHEAALRFQKAALGTGPNISRNGVKVSSSPSPRSTSSKHWSQPARATIAESSNHGDTVMSNHIQQHYPTIMAPGNSGYLPPPASHSFQTYSVHP